MLRIASVKNSNNNSCFSSTLNNISKGISYSLRIQYEDTQ